MLVVIRRLFIGVTHANAAALAESQAINDWQDILGHFAFPVRQFRDALSLQTQKNRNQLPIVTVDPVKTIDNWKIVEEKKIKTPQSKQRNDLIRQES